MNHQVALGARSRARVANIDNLIAVAANLCVGAAYIAGRVRQLLERCCHAVIEKDLEIAVAVLRSDVSIRREGDEATVVGNRGLEVAVRGSIRRIAG